jgi:hypothetical protein
MVNISAMSAEGEGEDNWRQIRRQKKSAGQFQYTAPICKTLYH